MSVSLKLHISAEGGFKAALQWPIQTTKLAGVRI